MNLRVSSPDSRIVKGQWSPRRPTGSLALVFGLVISGGNAVHILWDKRVPIKNKGGSVCVGAHVVEQEPVIHFRARQNS